MNKKPLICIIGKTCVGKDTFVNNLINFSKEIKLRKSVSYTTRPKRDTEEDGDTHYFIDNSAFNSMRLNSDIVAYTKIGEYEYMTTLNELLNSDICILDPDGYDYLKNSHYGNLFNIYPILLEVDYDTQLSRFYKRCGKNATDKINDFTKRCNSEASMFEKFDRTGITVADTSDNNSIDDIYCKIIDIIKNYRKQLS